MSFLARRDQAVRFADSEDPRSVANSGSARSLRWQSATAPVDQIATMPTSDYPIAAIATAIMAN